MRIGITRLRNEAEIIESTLSRLENHLDYVIAYDDCSDDGTYEILKDHPFVKGVLRNNEWQTDPEDRKAAETWQRQEIYQFAMLNHPDWILYFDGDEHIYFDDIDWDSSKGYKFRLFDVYITPDDVNKHFSEREMIGAEYRDIPMLFRPPAQFFNRLPLCFHEWQMGGTVKHFGKGISVKQWEETCDYYINHLNETLATGETIAERWTKRKGKAIHTKSDFNHDLIKWDERHEKGFRNIN